MARDLTLDMSANMKSIISKAVDIVNDDFSPNVFAKAFPSTIPKISKNKPFLNFITEQTNDSSNNQPRSCPSASQPVFIFKESSFAPQKSFEDSDIVSEKPNTASAPTLKLQITGNPSYSLDECDILDVVSNFGSIVNVEVTGPRTAFITFDEAFNAIDAQKALNGHQVKHLNIKMYFSCTENLKETVVEPKERRTQRAKTFIPSTTNIDQEFNSNAAVNSLTNLDSTVPVFQFNKTDKLTTKYEVQIEGDQDFKISSKIIGPKGVNMKKILDVCQQHAKRANIPFQNDSLKLRLRGIGSGFKEGPERKESNEPLHLCISAKHPKIYEVACKLVEELLKGLYSEYQIVCQNLGRPLEAPIQIKRMGVQEEQSDDEKKAVSRKDSMDEKVVEKKTKKVQENSTSDSGSPANSMSSLSEKNSPPTQWRSPKQSQYRSPQSQWRTIAKNN